MSSENISNSDIESVTRLRDLNPPPEGNKSGADLLDLLKAEANPANALKVLKFLGDRLGNKQISLEAEVNGTKMINKFYLYHFISYRPLPRSA